MVQWLLLLLLAYARVIERVKSQSASFSDSEFWVLNKPWASISYSQNDKLTKKSYLSFSIFRDYMNIMIIRIF